MEQLATYADTLRRIEDAREAAVMQQHVAHRRDLEPLLAQRDAHLRHVADFWRGVLALPHTPLAELMNGTIDPKLAAAVTDVRVTTQVQGDATLLRTVSLTLKANMCAHEGTVSRTVDADGVTHALQPIAWKSGFDRARRDSLFRLFDASSNKSEGDEVTSSFVLAALDAFDLVYQDPFLAMQDD